MKPGDKVRIYQKPYTDEDFEGIATLVAHHLGSGTVYWAVRFDDDIECSRLSGRTVFERHVIAN